MADRPEAELAGRPWPSVTVVVVNYNGRDYLERCLSSLAALDYPQDRVEVILVDNASTDGSVELVREAFPDVTVVVNDENTGFAAAVNQGAQEGSGRCLALINNDAEADRGWLREAVKALEAEPRVACVASKILREDRETVDFAGGQASFYGHGFARGVDEAQTADHGNEVTLFASGAAMVVDRRLFISFGGFDESYFAFFEDVDFGWRVWLLGHEVLYVPSSRVYHRHHGTIERFGYPRERYLLERNALATIFKNFSEERLARILPAAMLLTLFRGLDVDGLELPDYRIPSGDDDPAPVADLTVPAITGAHFAALRDFALWLDDLREKRDRIQDQRLATDRELLKLFEESMRPNIEREDFLEAFQQVVRAFDLNEHARGRSAVLILTHDRIAERMAGPAIRCWEMAKVLAHEHEVTLAGTQEITLSHEAFRCVQVDDDNIDALLHDAEIVIFQGFVMHLFPQIEASDKLVVVDIYDPFHLEGLNMRKAEGAAERFAATRSDVRVLNEQLERADFLVCASEKQRDFWLGQLSGIGRINPATFDADESLRRLIDVAPFGLPSEPPKKTKPVLKGVVDGLGEDDFLLLWGGGIYNWFDPLTLIRAVGAAAEKHPDVKLFFMGAGHPNPDIPKMKMAAEALRLAEELDLVGTQVFFNEDWIAYEERADYLLEADVGVSTHLLHIETAFSYRTRILDYLWAGLPVLATEGDSLSRLVTSHELGLTVPPEDVDALADAISRLRTDRELYEAARANALQLAQEMTWDRALAPVMDFCRKPRPAPDRVGRAQRYLARRRPPLGRSPFYYARRFYDYARTAGVSTAMLHTRNFMRSRRP